MSSFNQLAYGESFTKINTLVPSMKMLDIIFIVLEITSKSKTKEGSIITQVLVADQTGSISLTLWEDKAIAVKPGYIFILKGGYV